MPQLERQIPRSDEEAAAAYEAWLRVQERKAEEDKTAEARKKAAVRSSEEVDRFLAVEIKRTIKEGSINKRAVQRTVERGGKVDVTPFLTS